MKWKSQAIYPPTRLKLRINGCVNHGNSGHCVFTFTYHIYTAKVQPYGSTAHHGPVNVLRRQILFAVGPTCRLILSRTSFFCFSNISTCFFCNSSFSSLSFATSASSSIIYACFLWRDLAADSRFLIIRRCLLSTTFSIAGGFLPLNPPPKMYGTGDGDKDDKSSPSIFPNALAVTGLGDTAGGTGPPRC